MPDDSTQPTQDVAGERTVRVAGNVHNAPIVTGDANKVMQVFGNIVQKISTIPRWLKMVMPFIVVVGLVTLGVTVDQYALINQLTPNPLAPMPLGTWNVAVVAFAVDDDGAVGCDNNQGKALGNRMHALMQRAYGEDHVRFVPCVVGDEDERRDRVADYAQRLNAHVVIYGVIKLDEPIGQATFTPELYIHPAEHDGVLYTEEILGQTTFGAPVQFVPTTTGGPENDEINRRLAALRHFVEGVRHYIVDNFDGARYALQAAIGELDTVNETQPSGDKQSEGDDHARAVVHEFLSAVELSEGIWYEVDQGDTEQALLHYTQAIREAQRAHELWESYARPFLTRGSAMFSLARVQRPDGPLPSPVDHLSFTHPVQCFGDELDHSVTFQQMLRISWQCYTDVLGKEAQYDDMALAKKVHYTRANILLLWSLHSDEAYWQEAWGYLDEFVKLYENATAEEQLRLRRIAAHAYARRGLMQAYYLPDRGCLDLRQQAAEDYNTAIRLLVEPFPGVSCEADLSNCQEGDKRFIAMYREERDQLYSGIEHGNSVLGSCQTQ